MQHKKVPQTCPLAPQGGIGKRAQKEACISGIDRHFSRQPALSINPFSKLLTSFYRSCRDLRDLLSAKTPFVITPFPFPKLEPIASLSVQRGRVEAKGHELL